MQIDASGAERPQHRYYRDFADGGASHPYATDAGFADFAGAETIIVKAIDLATKCTMPSRYAAQNKTIMLQIWPEQNGWPDGR